MKTEPVVVSDVKAVKELAAAHSGTVDPQIIDPRTFDWTRRWHGHSPALFRPKTTKAFSQLLAQAYKTNIPACIQGGNTSLTGGATPFGEIILSTDNLTDIDLDVKSLRATVGAGVTPTQLNEALASSGLEFGIDLASRDSATIGGMISTNAAGLKVLRWGKTASQILGLQVVLANGTILSHLNPPDRDNTGIQWQHLFAGAEGTMGVVTQATYV